MSNNELPKVGETWNIESGGGLELRLVPHLIVGEVVERPGNELLYVCKNLKSGTVRRIWHGLWLARGLNMSKMMRHVVGERVA